MRHWKWMYLHAYCKKWARHHGVTPQAVRDYIVGNPDLFERKPQDNPKGRQTADLILDTGTLPGYGERNTCTMCGVLFKPRAYDDELCRACARKAELVTGGLGLCGDRDHYIREDYNRDKECPIRWQARQERVEAHARRVQYELTLPENQ